MTAGTHFLLLAILASATASDLEVDSLAHDAYTLLSECPPTNEGQAVLLPHHNCSNFYICNWGQKVQMECPQGLHFNPNLQVCDWPDHAGCRKQCPPTNEGEVVFIPHDDCGKYYVCDWGEKIQMNCPQGLHFNPRLNVCDWPWSARCNSSVANLFRTRPRSRCLPSNDGEAVLLPHPDCRKFYMCNWGVEIEMSCPPDLYFNPDLRVCDASSEQYCEVAIVPN